MDESTLLFLGSFAKRCIVAGAALAITTNAFGADVPKYRIVDIGTLGGVETYAEAINDKGQVTGGSNTADGSMHAFLYRNGRIRDLGTLGGGSSFGNDVNALGQVTGDSQAPNFESHAFLYANGVMTDISGGVRSKGNALNDRGQVTGFAYFPGRDYDAFLYTPSDGSFVDLGTLGDSYSRGDAINESGQVVGLYQDRYLPHAFVAKGGSMVDLAASSRSYVPTGAKLINDCGHIALSYYTKPGGIRAALYRNGTLEDLGTLGGPSSSAAAINKSDEITGYAATPDGQTHAFLYSHGTMHDLGALGGSFAEGVAINDAGEVAGTASTSNGDEAFVYSGGETTPLDVAPLGGLESYAFAINNRGQVLGQYLVSVGHHGEATFRSFLATPIALLFSSLVHKAATVEHARSLETKARIAAKLYAHELLPEACVLLGNFQREARARAGSSLDRRAARTLGGAAADIAAALSCASGGGA